MHSQFKAHRSPQSLFALWFHILDRFHSDICSLCVVYITVGSNLSCLIALFFQPVVRERSHYPLLTELPHALVDTHIYWRWQSCVLNQQFCSLFDLIGTFAQCQAVQFRARLPKTNRNKSCSVSGLGTTLTGKFKPWLSRNRRSTACGTWHFEQSDSAHMA